MLLLQGARPNLRRRTSRGRENEHRAGQAASNPDSGALDERVRLRDIATLGKCLAIDNNLDAHGVPDVSALLLRARPEQRPLTYKPSRHPQSWQTLQQAEIAVPSMRGICTSVAESWMLWQDWRADASAHRAPLPEGWEEKLNRFQKIIVVRALAKVRGAPTKQLLFRYERSA